MKFIFCLLTLLFNMRRATDDSTLTVKITNVKTSDGQIAVALYDSEKKFMESTYQIKTGKAKAGSTEIIFENIPPGHYAISVMHDKNENKKLDTNLFGIPTEGFGFSNNAMGRLGPPSFQKAKIDFRGSQQISITLKYL